MPDRRLNTLFKCAGLAVCWIVLELPIQGQAADCSAANASDLAAAGTYLRSGTARTSTATTPFSVDIETNGPLFLSLIRRSKTLQAPVKLRVLAEANQRGPYRLVCETQWLPLGEAIPSRFFSVAPGGRVASWRVQILDRADGGPTGDPPYVVEFQLKTNVPYAGNHFADAPANFDGECSVVSVPPRANSTQVEAVSLELNNGVGSSVARFFDAGRRVYLQFDNPREKHTTRISLKLSAQNAGAFRNICTVSERNIPRSGFIMASLDWPKVERVRWLIEVFNHEQTASSSPETNVRVLRDNDPELFPASPTPTRVAQHSPDLLCLNPVTTREGAPTNSVIRFGSKVAIKVRFDDSSNILRPSRLDLISEYLVRSTGLWRATCLGCVSENMTVITLNDQIYMHPALVDGLRGLEPASLPTPPVPPHQPGPLMFMDLIDDREGTARGAFLQYRQVTLEDPAIRHLCSIRRTSMPDNLARIADAVGCSDSAAKDSATASFIFRLVNGATACGDSKNIIACEPDQELVELNVRDFAFVDHDTSAVAFGYGETKVDLLKVLLHEYGHWVGLGHLFEPGNIMAESYSYAECIDGTDAGTLYRLSTGAQVASKGPMAFYYASPSR